MDSAIAQQALLDGLRNLCDNTEATFDPDAFTAASVRGFALQLQDLAENAVKVADEMEAASDGAGGSGTVPGDPLALLMAAEAGDATLVIRHLVAGVDAETKDALGRGAIHIAAKGGHTKIVKVLAVHGADVNSTAGGMTPLMFGCRGNNLEIVQAVVAKGAALNTKSHGGMTALMWAAIGGHTEIANFLMAKGASVRLKDGSGMTALMHAAMKGHTEMCKALLAKGADVKAKCEEEMTAADYALQHNHPVTYAALDPDSAHITAETMWESISLSKTTDELTRVLAPYVYMLYEVFAREAREKEQEEEAQRLHEVAIASESLVSQQLVDPAKAAEVIREAVSPRSGSKSPRPRVSFDGSPTDNGAGAIAFAPAATSGGSPARALDHGAMVQLKELAGLKESGILTEEEFAAQKATLLAGGR